MTQLMEKAIEKIQQLSDEEQDTLATMILVELESEKKWTGI